MNFRSLEIKRFGYRFRWKIIKRVGTETDLGCGLPGQPIAMDCDQNLELKTRML
jgi:hypothetical protein